MSAAQSRIADALLRALGGETVLLQIPAPAVPGDLAEQLGIAAPLFQNVALGPAVLRKLRPRIATAESEKPAEYELLLSASAVAKALGTASLASAEVLFAQACAITVGGRLLQITSVTASEAFGEPCLYRLGLRAAATDLV